MIIDYNKIVRIIGLLLLFLFILVCIQGLSVIYASEGNDTVTISNDDVMDNVSVNKSYISFQAENKSYIEIKDKDTLYTYYPSLTVTSKPSCQSCHKTMSYKWRTRSWVNYCPHCKRYNSLIINPKRVYEVEITCKYCDSDYCGVCGHDKCANYYRHRNYQLRAL